MRILVTGSRVWNREDLVRGAIHQYLVDQGAADIADVVIIHGACPTGADLHAARWASDFDVRQETYPANWGQHGKAAGPIRNQQMVDAGADVCLAFPLGASRGTRDCMARARKAGIPVKSYDWMPPGTVEDRLREAEEEARIDMAGAWEELGDNMRRRLTPDGRADR